MKKSFLIADIEVKGICFYKPCVLKRIITDNNLSKHASHSSHILLPIRGSSSSSNSSIPSATTLIDYFSNPQIKEVFDFLDNPNDDLLNNKVHLSVLQKELDIDDIFERIKNELLSTLSKVKNDFKLYSFKRQRQCALQLVDILKQFKSNLYDLDFVDSFLKNQATKLAEINYHENLLKLLISEERKHYDKLLVSLYNLLDSPLHFNEAPSLNNIKLTYPDLDSAALSDYIKQLNTSLSSVASSFDKLITNKCNFHVNSETLTIDKIQVLKPINLQDNGWILSLATYPPLKLIREMNDKRTENLIVDENHAENLTMIMTGSTTGSVNIFGFNGKLKEVLSYAEDKIISNLVSIPPFRAENRVYHLLASIAADNDITLWDLVEKKRLRSITTSLHDVISSAILLPIKAPRVTEPKPFGTPKYESKYEVKYYLTTCGLEGSIVLWNIIEGKPFKSIVRAHRNGVLGVAFLPYKVDGGMDPSEEEKMTSFVVSYGKDYVIKIWKMPEARILSKCPYPHLIKSLVVVNYEVSTAAPQWNPLGKLQRRGGNQATPFVVFCDLENSLVVVNLMLGKIVRKVRNAHSGVQKIECVKAESVYWKGKEIGSLNNVVITAGKDMSLKVWNWVSGACLHVVNTYLKLDGMTFTTHRNLGEGEEQQELLVCAGRTSAGTKMIKVFR